jgi:hypothetical protein
VLWCAVPFIRYAFDLLLLFDVVALLLPRSAFDCCCCCDLFVVHRRCLLLPIFRCDLVVVCYFRSRCCLMFTLMIYVTLPLLVIIVAHSDVVVRCLVIPLRILFVVAFLV